MSCTFERNVRRTNDVNGHSFKGGLEFARYATSTQLWTACPRPSRKLTPRDQQRRPQSPLGSSVFAN